MFDLWPTLILSCCFCHLELFASLYGSSLVYASLLVSETLPVQYVYVWCFLLLHWLLKNGCCAWISCYSFPFCASRSISTATRTLSYRIRKWSRLFTSISVKTAQFMSKERSMQSPLVSQWGVIYWEMKGNIIPNFQWLGLALSHR